jgi:hypothetical protein
MMCIIIWPNNYVYTESLEKTGVDPVLFWPRVFVENLVDAKSAGRSNLEYWNCIWLHNVYIHKLLWSTQLVTIPLSHERLLKETYYTN